jgi:hypothetical protein
MRELCAFYCRLSLLSVDGFLLQSLSCFLHLSGLEFLKRDFFYMITYLATLAWICSWNLTNPIVYKGAMSFFTAGCRPRRWMPSCFNHFCVFFICLALSSQSGTFLYHYVAFEVRFDMQLEAHKSDIVRGSYELCTASCRSRQWMAYCCNHFCVFFISLALSSQRGIFYIIT